jgi:hypothetical protein
MPQNEGPLECRVGEVMTLGLKDGDQDAYLWHAFPANLVKLAPASDHRSCLVSCLTTGMTTIKSRTREGIPVAYFVLSILPPVEAVAVEVGTETATD